MHLFQIKIWCLRIVFVSMAGISFHVSADETNDVLLIEADLDFGEYLAGECSACHNPNTSVDMASAVPIIHGASQQSIVANLLAYRSGERVNTTMRGVAGGLSNEEIAAIAAYLASLATNEVTKAKDEECSDCDNTEN